MIEIEQQWADNAYVRAKGIRPHSRRGIARSELEQEPAVSEALVSWSQCTMKTGVQLHV
jgi:hypothetical protein